MLLEWLHVFANFGTSRQNIGISLKFHSKILGMCSFPCSRCQLHLWTFSASSNEVTSLTRKALGFVPWRVVLPPSLTPRQKSFLNLSGQHPFLRSPYFVILLPSLYHGVDLHQYRIRHLHLLLNDRPIRLPHSLETPNLHI